MLPEVEVAAVVYAFQFAPAEGVMEFEIECRFGVVRQLLRRMLMHPQHVVGDAQLLVVLLALLKPIRVPSVVAVAALILIVILSINVFKANPVSEEPIEYIYENGYTYVDSDLYLESDISYTDDAFAAAYFDTLTPEN